MKRYFSILAHFLTVFAGFSLILVSTLSLAGPPLKEGNPGVPGLLAEIAALEDEIADLQDQVATLQSKALVPKTGQTACWGAFGGPPIDCDDTGQDGDIQAGVMPPDPRFTINVNEVDDNGVGGGVPDNGICDGDESCNGTVTDHLTGLIWLLDANCNDLGLNGDGSGLWQEALDAANGLADGVCGLDDGSIAGDWRLPNVRELQSLIDYDNSAPALPTGHPFFNIPFSFVIRYWSSTTHYLLNWAWFVNLGDGITSSDFKFLFDKFIWPVRGGQ